MVMELETKMLKRLDCRKNLDVPERVNYDWVRL